MTRDRVGRIGRAAVAALLALATASMAPPSGSTPGEARGSWSFEAGLPPDFYVRFRGRDGFADQPGVEWQDPRPTLDGDAAFGKACLALPVPAHGRVIVHTPALEHARTLAVSLRSDPPGDVVLRLFEAVRTDGKSCGARQREIAARGFPVGAAWARYHVSARESAPGVVFGELETDGPRRLFVDGVELEAASEASAFREPIEVVISMVPADADGKDAREVPGVIAPGAAARFAVSLSRPRAQGERLEVTVLDARDRPIRVTRERGGEPTRVGFVAQPASLGPFAVRAELRAPSGEALAVAGRAFDVVPPPVPVPVEHARLGAHTRLDPRHLAIAERLGFRWLRLHDTSMIGQWITAEPEPGRFQFFDDAIDHARDRGFAILGVLEATPRWASSAPPSVGWYEARSFPPRDPSDWQSYVRAVVSHYRGRIDAWEVWNEPYLDEFWRGTPAAYSALLSATLEATRVATVGNRPGPLLLVSGAVEGKRRAFTESAIGPAAPAAARVSVLSSLPATDGARLGVAFHPYDGRLVEHDPPIAERVAELVSLVGGRAPMWATEGSVLAASASRLARPGLAAADPERAGAAMVAWVAELLSAGAERVFPYFLVESAYPSDADLSLLDADGTPRPAAVALAVLARSLGDRHPLRSTHADGCTAWLFGAAGESTLILVAGDDLRPLSFAGPRRFRDVWGNPLLDGQRPPLAWAEVAEHEDPAPLLHTVRAR